MVTRGNPKLVRSSVASFRAQIWPNRELVVVSCSVTTELRDILVEPNERLIEAPLGLSLGDLRNLSVASSQGEYLIVWDDDDLFDPNRISVMVQVLRHANVSAVFLNQLLIWWQERDLLALSGRRIWEGSMLALRGVIPVYPSMPKSEDAVAVDMLKRHHSYALVDAPLLYCYRVTGQNTWDERHFENLLAQSSKPFENPQKSEILRRPCFNFV